MFTANKDFSAYRSMDYDLFELLDFLINTIL